MIITIKVNYRLSNRISFKDVKVSNQNCQSREILNLLVPIFPPFSVVFAFTNSAGFISTKR